MPRKGQYTRWRPKTEEEQIKEHARKQAVMLKNRQKNKALNQPMRYAAILELVRTDTENLGRLARIALFNQGSRSENRRKAYTHRDVLQRHLDRYKPMEHWDVCARVVPETWGDFQLMVAYHGTFATERERAKYRAERKSRSPWAMKQAKGARER